MNARSAADHQLAEARVIDPREFRSALGAFVTGVTVVTSTFEGKPVGFTANSFSSVSLDPPLISVCIGKSSSNFAAFDRAGAFNVSVLSESQRHVSQAFSAKGVDRFSMASWRAGSLGHPIIQDSAAWFECTLHQRVDAGDHYILIGRVESFGHTTNSPLGYCRGSYVLFHLEQQLANWPTKRTRVGALIETPQGVLMVPDENNILVLPHSHKIGSRKSEDGLYQTLGKLIENFEVDFLYSVWEDNVDGILNIYYRGTAEGNILSDKVHIVPVHALESQATTHDISVMLNRYVKEQQESRYSIYPGLPRGNAD